MSLRAFACTVLLSVAAGPALADDFTLQHVTVVDVDDGILTRDQVVRIVGARIVEVGPAFRNVADSPCLAILGEMRASPLHRRAATAGACANAPTICRAMVQANWSRGSWFLRAANAVPNTPSARNAVCNSAPSSVNA